MRTPKTSFGMPSALWTQSRDASLNWLALGVLLAAWNAVDDASAAAHRPESLRAHPCVTVRSMTRGASFKGHKSFNEL